MVPGLDEYFITSKYDDFDSVAGFYGPAVETPSALRGIAHGMTTMPGMISVICCALGAVLVGVVLLLATRAPTIAGTAAVVAFLVLFGLMAVIAYRAATGFARSVTSKFPPPPKGGERS
jgi:hypothetical protein